jgi:hypothetical protein
MSIVAFVKSAREIYNRLPQRQQLYYESAGNYIWKYEDLLAQAALSDTGKPFHQLDYDAYVAKGSNPEWYEHRHIFRFAE